MSTPIYILGGSQTDFARNWSREGLTIFDMFSEILNDALTNAKLTPDQIQVAHVGNFVGDLFTGQGLLNGFFGEVHPEMSSIPTSRHEAACASGSIAILSAMRDIESGHYDLACVLGLEYMRNVDGKTGADHLGAATWRNKEAQDATYPWPYMFNQIIDEYDKRYGIDCQYLKDISKINFSNAQNNPNAQTRNWDFPKESFTNNDQYNPVIEGRIRKMDCGQITDGAACVFLANEATAKVYAKKHQLKLKDIPRIKGWGHRSAAISLETKLKISAGQPLIFPHVAQIMTDALARAGLSDITELDGLETHDCFSITEYMAIDHIGLTSPGESWKAIEEGRISMDGDFPINPSGGLLGLGHPVGATGIRMLLDCAKQVSGKAKKSQVKNAENMATFNLGGSTTTCVSFIVGVN
jgi:acetyl-CoA C-acetyltransferase|tara:strand:- start:1923 stop:3155 length:1233 start_codon:yes stop_codon:yes gene_type:complete